MAQLVLTNEQIAASSSRRRRTFIEANPGSGKTTVAAERFGILRFDNSGDASKSIAAVSFTRSATNELHQRIRDRWGSNAYGWPHRVTTIDRLLCDIAHYLLQTKKIRWMDDHTEIEVLDHWRGHKGYRFLKAGVNYRRVATLDDNGHLISASRRVVQSQFGFGTKSDFHFQLKLGRCTHEDIRDVLNSALKLDRLKSEITNYLSSTITHLVVDEVFDANDLDLQLVDLCCSQGIDTTIIGDPWQALYGFRGAQPDLVPKILESRNFTSLPLSQSFRFQSDEMKSLSTLLRSSQPVEIPANGLHEVVLAPRWDDIWKVSDNVLPLSFGQIKNKTDAAAILLLDYLVYAKFFRRAIFFPEALILLGLDPDVYSQEGHLKLAEVFDILSKQDHDAPEQALNHLRGIAKSLGAPRRPPRGRGDAEQRQIQRLSWIKSRLQLQDHLVPGMTIHQAKGREWDHVGVRFNDSEMSRLESGLDPQTEGDRALYVALTRARYSVSTV